MKILLDMNLSPTWKQYLASAGYVVEHWINIGLPNAPDTEIMEWARENDFAVFTHDLDFSALLYSTNARAPSVIQIRAEDIRPQTIGKLVLSALKEHVKSVMYITDHKLVKIKYSRFVVWMHKEFKVLEYC